MLRNTGHAIGSVSRANSSPGHGLVGGGGADGEAGVDIEISGDRPSADNLIHHAVGVAGEVATTSKRQVVNHETIERAGDVADAAAVIGLLIVNILEEEISAVGLALANSFLIAVLPEVPKRVR